MIRRIRIIRSRLKKIMREILTFVCDCNRSLLNGVKVLMIRRTES